MSDASSKSLQGASADLEVNAGKTRVWIRVGKLFDGQSRQPLRDAHLVYDSDTILFVGSDKPSREFLRPDQEVPDVVLTDVIALPGLIEAHAHLFLEGGELELEKRSRHLKQTPEQLLALAKPRFSRLLQVGVMAVRDAGDKDGVGLSLSSNFRERTRDSALTPYLDSPGAAIHRRGRYGKFMAEALELHDSLEDCVEARLRDGADRIKLIPTGIINFKAGKVTSSPQMSVAEVSEIVKAARVRGCQTFAHASGTDGIENAIEGGVDSVEHGFFITDEQLAKMRDRSIAWVPTFAPVQEQVDHADIVGWDETVVSHLRRILDEHARSLCRAHEMGVVVIAGSDAGSYGVAHGYGLLDELCLMESAGMPPVDVLRSATGSSAGRLAFREKFGVLEAGYRPRFLLTRADPLVSVAQLRNTKLGVFDGRVVVDDLGPEKPGL